MECIAEPVIKFEFDSETIRDFTNGFCYQLAIALCQKFRITNKSIYEIMIFMGTYREPNYTDTHYVVKMPLEYVSRLNLPLNQSYYIDVLGIWTELNLIKYWENIFLKCEKSCCKLFKHKLFNCKLRLPEHIRDFYTDNWNINETFLETTTQTIMLSVNKL